jgi:hypothetical protein
LYFGKGNFGGKKFTLQKRVFTLQRRFSNKKYCPLPFGSNLTQKMWEIGKLAKIKFPDHPSKKKNSANFPAQKNPKHQKSISENPLLKLLKNLHQI